MDNAVIVEQLEQFLVVNPLAAIRLLHAFRTPYDGLELLGEKSHAGHIKRIRRRATVYKRFLVKVSLFLKIFIT